MCFSTPTPFFLNSFIYGYKNRPGFKQPPCCLGYSQLSVFAWRDFTGLMILCVHRQEEHAVNKQPSPIKQQNVTVRVHEMWSSCFMKLVILRICSFIRATISVLITATNHKLIIACISILACYSLIFKPCLLLPSKDFDFPKYKAQIQSVKVQNSFRLFFIAQLQC